MINTTYTSPEELNALEKAIRKAVQDRIDTDPDVADFYLRIDPNSWTVRVMYLEESNLTAPNRDVPFLDLMIDLKGSYGGNEDWVLNDNGIRKVVNDYSEMIEIDFCQN